MLLGELTLGDFAGECHDAPVSPITASLRVTSSNAGCRPVSAVPLEVHRLSGLSLLDQLRGFLRRYG